MLQLETVSDTQPSPARAGSPGPVTIDHVVDACRRYPGELVTLYTRLTVLEATADLTMRISLPPELTLEDYHAGAGPLLAYPTTEMAADSLFVAWRLPGNLPAGSRLEVQTTARVAPVTWETTLESRAVVFGGSADLLAAETAVITAVDKAGYLQHLPAIFEQDRLLNGLLMLFESFWSPIKGQIEQGHYYLDPRLAPSRFLPWLASWLDLALDDNWPEARQRQLVRWAIALHRSRGTRWGLQKYLEIYTGQVAEITEFRAKNFTLGESARLGPGLALGRSNAPHTFAVTLRLPPLAAGSEAERARREAIRRRTIAAIIDRQKPAHTVYTLTLEPLEPAKPAAGAQETPPPAKTEIDELAAIWFKLNGQERKR